MPDNIIDTLNLQINGESSKAISAVNEIINKLDNLKNKVGELNKIKVSLGIGPKSGVNLKAFGEAIDGLNIEKFKQFAQATSLVTKMSFGISKDTGDNLSMFAMALDDLDVGKMFEFGAATNAIAKVSLGMSDKTGEYLSGFATALNTLDLEKLREFSAINESFANVNTGLSKKTSEHLISFGIGINGINVDKLKQIARIDFSNLKPLAEAGKYIDKFTGYINKLNIASTKALKSQQALADATKTVAKTTRSSGHSFSFASTMVGRFLASVKRIAIHRLIRNMLRSLTQGFSEGIENLYYWSQAVGTSFAPRMDQLATSVQYLKNGFASMFSPLIERAIPILDVLIDKVVDVFNVVQELFARLTGQATWNKALKYPVTYKDQLDDATKSAKALQNILMDFDELNVINTPKAGSSGSAADAKDYSAMFQLMSTSTGESPLGGLAPIFDDIAGKLGKLWSTVKKFIDFFFGLDFSGIKDSLERFWGVVSPILDELNSDIEWLEEKIIEPITEFFTEEAIPAGIDTMTTAIDSLWSAFKPLKDGIKSFWDQNGDWIMKLFEEHTMKALGKIKEAFEKIGKFFDKNKSTIKSIFSSLSDIATKTSPLTKAIASMLGTHAWDTFVDSINSILYALEPVLTSLDAILKLVNSIISADPSEFYGSLRGIWRALIESFLNPIKLIIDGFATVIDALSHIVGIFDYDAGEAMRNFAEKCRGVVSDMDNVDLAFADWLDSLEQTSDVTVIAADKVRELESAGSSAARENFWAWVNANNGIVDAFGNVVIGAKNSIGKKQTWKDMGSSSAGELSYQFTSALSPTAGFNLGKAFGENIQKGMNPAGIGWNLGAQMAANAQAALNMSPLQLQATINAKITSVNANDKWRAALAAAGVSIAGFATGGFPTPGTLFAAGEIPGQAEMLGTIGGRTAVAGGEEITGIREAIYEQGQREENLLRSLISAVNSKDLTLVANSATGRWVNKALKSYAGVTG